MTKIITCAELPTRRLEELQTPVPEPRGGAAAHGAGFGRPTTALANLENVSRAMATCLARQPHPRLTP
jgi:hypothetical protein